MTVSNWVLFFSVSWDAVDRVTELVSARPGFLGLEELPDADSNLYGTSDEFEVLEFGSDAAKKCADWLESGDFQKNRSSKAFVKVYFERGLPSAIENISEWKEFFSAEKSIESLTEEDIQIISWQPLPDEDYLANYRKQVRGQAFGKNLWIGPPWEVPPSEKDIFFVEPGMAFGTGDHPTTQMCLEILESLSSDKVEDPLKISKTPIYDIGTGTGVLALAARRFFPERSLILTDLDPLCGPEVKKTFELNKTSMQNVELRLGAAADLKSSGVVLLAESGKEQIHLLHNMWPQSNLIISNIYAEVLQGLLPELAALCLPGAYWVVSGVLESAASKTFDNEASKYFELLDAKSSIVEEAQLSRDQGLNAKQHVWLARLFKRR